MVDGRTGRESAVGAGRVMGESCSSSAWRMKGAAVQSRPRSRLASRPEQILRGHVEDARSVDRENVAIRVPLARRGADHIGATIRL